MTAGTLPTVSRFRSWGLANVFTKSLADRMTLVTLTGAGLFLMSMWMGPLYNSLEDSLEEMSANLGEGMMALFGDVATPAGFINAEMYSLFVPGFIIYVAVSSAARAFATEEENHSIGLLAANPLSRTAIAVQKAAAMVVHVLVVTVLCALGVWAGIEIAGLDVPVSNIAAVNLHMGLFGIAVGALAMLVAVLTGRRIISMVTAAAIVLIAYVWGSFAPQTEQLEGLAVLSPWHWYFGTDPFTNGVAWGHAGLLALLALALLAAATWMFNRRDLPG